MRARNGFCKKGTHSIFAPKILLIEAPYLRLYGGAQRGVAPYFPLGLGYIASYLEKQGASVEILSEGEFPDLFTELSHRLQATSFSLIGISSMSPAFPGAVRCARLIRQRAPHTRIILGGAHASALGKDIVKSHSEFDFVCIGEGEIPMACLIGELGKPTPNFASIDNLVWRNGDEIIQNRRGDFVQNIDQFGFPARHLVDFSRYSLHEHVTGGLGNGAAMVTSRGCPFPCVFCSAHITHGRKYRFHSDDHVLNELLHLKNTFHIDYVFFEDDSFTIVKERVFRLCNRLIQADLKITFGCFSRVDVFNAELASLLARAGCRLVIFGIESGVPAILKKLQKGASLEEAENAVRLCRSHGITSFASFIVGLPFETKKDIRETLKFGRRLNASVVTFNPFVPFPGTALFQEKFLPQNLEGWEKFLTTGAPPFQMVKGLSPETLKRIVDSAHLRYYLMPHRLFKALWEVRSIQHFMCRFQIFLSFLWSSLYGKPPDSHK